MMLGIATWRARVLPRAAAVMLTIGVPLGLTLSGVSSLVLLVYGVAAAWLGVAAFRLVSTDTPRVKGIGRNHRRTTARTAA